MPFESGSKDNCSIAIIGAGPAGCMAAYFAGKNHCNRITIFDNSTPLKTILPTGGGRCNLAHAEYDFRELAKYYPRGEKFLLSVFSRFSTADTIDFFEKIGVETYCQEDFRFFPKSDSAKDVREHILDAISFCGFKREKVLKITPENEKFSIKTDKNVYTFDKVVIAIGGHAGFELVKNLGHKIVCPKPALVGLISTENFSELKGVSVKASATVHFDNKEVYASSGDVLFAHKGVSGPLVYEISSVCARYDYSSLKPLIINLDFVNEDIDFQNMLNENAKKDIKNLVSNFVPKSLAEYILKKLKIKEDKKCFEINGENRDRILNQLKNFEIRAVSPFKDGEVVTSGGVCLDEINSKDMQSKLFVNLYFCGEVIDVDGFCGGFNLQNCWSTGFIAGNSLSE